MLGIEQGTFWIIGYYVNHFVFVLSSDIAIMDVQQWHISYCGLSYHLNILPSDYDWGSSSARPG